MKRVMTCEICGGHHLVKAYGGVFLCEDCGTKYTLEEARCLWNGNYPDEDNAMAMSFMDRQLQRWHERKLERMRLRSEERVARMRSKREPSERNMGCGQMILIGLAILIGGPILLVAILMGA